jgi:pimeloyl-ACP methyl ester carboxylesterase
MTPLSNSSARPYVRCGRGPTVVFIPGLCSDALTFAPLMTLLQADFDCIAYDLRERGDYEHNDLVSDLFALLDDLRIRSAALVGFSFGSTIALAALARQPHRFERAILQGGFARRPLAPAEVFACSWARYLPGSVGAVPLLQRLVTTRLHAAPFQQRAANDWHYFVASQGRTPLGAFARRALIMHRLDLRPLLPSIRQPVLLVCGERDPLVTRCYQEELRCGLPLTAVAEVEGSGHHPHLSHPEVLAEAIRHFLLPTAEGAGAACASSCTS